MHLMIDLTANEEARLFAAATRIGVAPNEFAHKLFVDQLPPLPTASPKTAAAIAVPKGRHSPQDRSNEISTILSERYDGINESTVCQFLISHGELSLILSEAIGPIDDVFGTGTSTALHLVTDHDSDDDTRLMARIRTKDTVGQARDKRKQFYQKWWNVNSERAQGLLVFGLEYV